VDDVLDSSTTYWAVLDLFPLELLPTVVTQADVTTGINRDVLLEVKANAALLHVVVVTLVS
jgi:hypothetical protein